MSEPFSSRYTTLPAGSATVVPEKQFGGSDAQVALDQTERRADGL
jgi:hypothetical protein